ncbi:MAG TPA: endopeptidase La, partial [Patescibacteria group bacterium]|nr:endopeptidase La [Patescibacteria group bacterium]
DEHYGIDKAKERILEFLAVMKLKKETKTKVEDAHPTILCFIGPPGVGKTSIGRSIAKALNRKFVRVSLGGIRDEAEIRGHRRTYVGALPGRIIQGIKDAGTKNPVFMLDEIDKIGIDFRGDPSSALLEALDPEQNKEFSDHYLEVPFDLSEVMFICTGNMLDTIPAPLRDRMEVITFPGYTEPEKYHIAKKFLWPKQLRVHGFENRKIEISEKGLKEVIGSYTREAGVRNLERNLASILRKVARLVAEKKKYSQKIEVSNVRKFLGSQRFTSLIAEKKDEVGMSTGLSVTPFGGEILFIEVSLMPGKGKLLLTGQLGDVMQESAKAAFTWTRSHCHDLGLKENFAEHIDVHIHVPEGAVPKDGPSAGVAITTALVSALTGISVKRDTGMTGEVTLRGRVLEIGGVKEKTIAGHRAGLKTIILPKDNRKDLDDVPEAVKRDIKFVFVEEVDDVLNIALTKWPAKKKVSATFTPISAMLAAN